MAKGGCGRVRKGYGGCEVELGAWGNGEIGGLGDWASLVSERVSEGVSESGFTYRLHARFVILLERLMIGVLEVVVA